MYVPRPIRKDDQIEVKYRGMIYAGPVRYSGCSKLPGKPGYDLDTVEFTNASTGEPHNWKPDIDEGAVLRRVTYHRPVCPTCNNGDHTRELDNLHSYWQCMKCGYQGIADVFILDDEFDPDTGPVDDMPALEALGIVLDIARKHVIDDPEMGHRRDRAIEALEKLL